VVTGPSQDSLPNDENFLPGAQFGAYQIVRALGAGAYGCVYEAKRLPLGNRFALKVLHSDLTASSKIVARFVREAEATAAIKHPHVVSTFEVGVVNRIPFIAMEFLEGETLHARLKRETKLPLQVVADIMVPVCSGVATVHERQMVHRDLKPENIMLTSPRAGVTHPIVLDFGVARALADDSLKITSATRAVGTPLYMSPEQLMDPGAVDARSDQWSIGVMLYLCLSGELPFSGRAITELMVKIASTPPEPLLSRVANIPNDVNALVMRALQRDASERFASVREIGSALLPHASLAVRATWEAEFAPFKTVQTATVAPVAQPRRPQPRRPQPWMVFGAAAAAIGAVIAAVVIAHGGNAPPRDATPTPMPMPMPMPTPTLITEVPQVPGVVSPDITVVEAVVTPDASVLDVIAVAPRPPRVRGTTQPRVSDVRERPEPTTVVGANGAVMR
jgi:eukaryotic-like serine/threonine-protein kinase